MKCNAVLMDWFFITAIAGIIGVALAVLTALVKPIGYFKNRDGKSSDEDLIGPPAHPSILNQTECRSMNLP